MGKILVSIVIINYNRKDLLKTALKSINKLDNIKKCETIVVDNASTDGSVDFLKKNYKNVKIVVNKKNLGYVGINSALPYCKGKYVFFLNNDIEIDKKCVTELLNVIEKDNKIGMVAPRLVNYYNKNLKSGGTWVSRAFYTGHMSGNEKLKEIPYLGVGLIRKDIVDKFGYLFDKDYFIYAEDLDLGLRLRLLGYKVIFVRGAILYHMHAVTTDRDKKYKYTFLLERNLLMTYLKIFSVKNILIFLPYILFIRLMAILKDIITFKFTNVLARKYAILWVISHFNIIYKKRKELQAMRKASDKFLLQVFTEKMLFSSKKIIV